MQKGENPIIFNEAGVSREKLHITWKEQFSLIFTALQHNIYRLYALQPGKQAYILRRTVSKLPFMFNSIRANFPQVVPLFWPLQLLLCFTNVEFQANNLIEPRAYLLTCPGNRTGRHAIYQVRFSGLSWFFNSVISRNFHNFGSTGPILKIFTFLEMASKFISTFQSGPRLQDKN